MGNLSLFLKGNKVAKKNGFYPATKSLRDENGNPLKWEIKALTTKETEKIREECTVEVQVTGKPGMFRPKVNGKEYVSKLIAASVVFPDLLNAELQDSYGVKTPEDLVLEMVDDPNEYNDFAKFVQEFNGLDESLQDKIDTAKN